MTALIIFTSSVAVVFMLAVVRALTKEARQRLRDRNERSLTVVMLERYRGRDRAA